LRLLKWIDKITKNHKKEKGVKKRFTLTTKGYREFKDLKDVTGIDLDNMEIIDLTKEDVGESK
jgi:hypothetical protein